MVEGGMSEKDAILTATIIAADLLGETESLGSIAKEKYADCSRAGNFSLQEDDDETACNKLIKGLYKINKDFEVPSMKLFGINQKNLMLSMVMLREQIYISIGILIIFRMRERYLHTGLE